jgi:PIN domain nuclease of toxin-antitoxin system
VIVLDAYGLVALLGDERGAADEVGELLESGDCAMPAVNLAEVVDTACRVQRLPLGEVGAALALLTRSGHLRVLACDEESAWRAAELRLRHYMRRVSEVSLADCFLLAFGFDAEAIATSDPPVAAAARAEGMGLIALADSTGRRP